MKQNKNGGDETTNNSASWIPGIKLKLIIGSFMLMALPFFCNAQQKMKEKERNGKVKMKESPSWAYAHNYNGKKDVYFPDYYVFYDHESDLYYYWSDGKWQTSVTIPTFMSTADLNKARVEVIKESITPDVKKEYIIYKKRYPAQKVEIIVPVPED